ncbi:GntR family transcriptional regulator [Streptomyces qinglanensis]|uniref:GntR family transcriptional regulator n=1 Tax=Streptomyces qinglanensis TaxID=943816 RepID=UPI0037913B24
MPRARTAYRRVADVLREQISSGALSPGSRIPSLSELQEQFGVSDTVILEARRILVVEGLLQARTGDGTYVRQRPSPQRLLCIETRPGQAPFRLEGDVAAQLSEPAEEPATVPVSEETARRLGVDPDEKVVRLQQLFRLDGSPAQMVTTYAATVADLTADAPLWEDELSVRPAADGEARSLQGIAGNPVTVVTRTVSTESGRASRVVETVMLAERFTIVYQCKGRARAAGQD